MSDAIIWRPDTIRRRHRNNAGTDAFIDVHVRGYKGITPNDGNDSRNVCHTESRGVICIEKRRLGSLDDGTGGTIREGDGIGHNAIRNVLKISASANISVSDVNENKGTATFDGGHRAASRNLFTANVTFIVSWCGLGAEIYGTA